MNPLAEAIDEVRAGNLIVLPTDTVYGIGGRPDSSDVTARIFEAKGRPRSLELPILVASAASAREVAEMDERAERLAAAFWPGALTMVLPRAPGAIGWDLGGDQGSVGVRVPAHRLALEVLRATGPMAVTSANPSGSAPLDNGDDLVAAFGDLVAVYVCEERPLVGVSSTVVDMTGDLRMLREGGVTESAIRAALA
ncbi:MAG: L-threonylcarbamoyladenylate synthase [Actinobacteria bacterium]|nr:L-threonylcarbamoyladenylate synthase [Actinomycetota bacterium]